MKKYSNFFLNFNFLITALLLLFCFSNSVFATGTVSFTADTIVSLSGISDGDLSVASGSEAASVDVAGAVLAVSAIPAGDSFTLKTPSSTNALKLTPSSGTLDFTFNSANLSAGNITEWTLTATGAVTVAHIVGVPLANTWYNIKIGGTVLNSYQSSAGGEVSFTYSGGWSTKVFTIEQDITAPTSFSLTSPANGASVSTYSPTFSWNASTDPDLSHYQLYVDNSLNRNNITGTFTTPIANLSYGDHTWYVKAVDNANNSSSTVSFSFSVSDFTAPGSFALSSPTNYSLVSSQQPTFSWGASIDSESGISKYQLYVDGSLNADNITGTSVIPANNLSCGNHTWYVKAIDNSLNSTNASIFNLTIECAGGALPPIMLQPPTSPIPSFENPTGDFKILINNIAENTNNRKVSLQLFAGADTKRMAISENSDFIGSSQEPYVKDREWILSKGDGKKTIYAKFFTEYGASSKVVFNEINLQTGNNSANLIINNNLTNINNNSSNTSLDSLPSAKFTAPLYRGMKNNDVKRLQQLLATDKEIYSEGLITGYFGPLTEKAVQKFQLKYKVVSSKKDAGYGYVGPKTRSKLNEIFK